MILGEPQILGQVKEAVQIARKQGCLNTHLAGVFEKALFVAKRVRNETEIAASAVSISYAAVELARKIFGDLKGKKVLVLGAGKMSELTAKHLMNSGIEGVVVSNRTYEKAVELAEQLNGQAARFDDIQTHLTNVDIVIASTSAPHHVLSRNQIAAATKERHHRPLFLIDIAVPRNIDPAANQLESVFLYNIDDLSQVVSMNLKMREKAAQQAEKIVRQEVDSFARALEIRNVGTQISDLRTTLEKICQEELSKAKSKLQPLSEAESQVLDLMVHRIVNKISHPLIMEIKRSPQESQSLSQRFVSLVQRSAPCRRPAPPRMKIFPLRIRSGTAISRGIATGMSL
jgi:glutamyl-tRNA reductase